MMRSGTQRSRAEGALQRQSTALNQTKRTTGVRTLEGPQEARRGMDAMRRIDAAETRCGLATPRSGL
mgnify:FL=1